MYGSLIFMISSVLIGAIGNDAEKSVSYTVGQVNEVQHSTVFSCRLRDYVWPTPVQFQVKLRNVQDVDDPNGISAARRFLCERLNNARQIRLATVRDRGYFQLTADVLVDGRDVGAEMIEYGLLRCSTISIETPKQDAALLSEPVLWGVQDSSEAVSETRPVSVALRTQVIEKYLTREADLSRIGPETTFEEALSLLAEAVQPRLPILILWNDLQRNAFIDRDTLIGIDGFGRMRLDKALELILRTASPPPAQPLAAVIEGGVLTIATGSGVIQKPRIEVYSAADILSAPSEDREQQTDSGGGTMR